MIWIVKATALLVAIYALVMVMRRASAATRHLAWTLGFVGLLVFPLLSSAVPWELDVLPAAARGSEDRLAARAAVVRDAPPATALAVDKYTSRNTVAPSQAASSAPPAMDRDAAHPTAPPDGRAARAWELPTTGRLLALLPMAWMLGLTLVGGRLLLGFAAVSWMTRRGIPIDGDPDWARRLRGARRDMQVRAPVRLVVSNLVAMPFTTGFTRPTIVLPAAATGWNDARRLSVLRHELAHIRRRDLWSHVLSQVACAVYWFHPMVWVAAYRHRAECERACDMMVLRSGTRASDYAEHLLDVVRGAARRWTPAVALPMARRSEFEGRLLAILETDVHTRPVTRVAAAALVLIVSAVALPVAALAPAAPAPYVPPIASEGPVASRPRADRPVTPVPEKAGARKDMTGTGERSAASSSVTDDWEANTDLAVEPSVAAAPLTQGSRMSIAVRLAVKLSDPVAAVRIEVAKALAEYQDTTSIAALGRTLLSDEDAEVRRAAAWALGEIEHPAAIPALSAALQRDADPRVRQMAAWALGQIEHADGVAALEVAVRGDADYTVRRTAVQALGEIEDRVAVPALITVLGDSSLEMRLGAIRALAEIEDERAVDGLLPLLRDARPEVRLSVAHALAEIESRRATAALTAALGDEVRDVRMSVVHALAEIEDPASVPALVEALGDADAEMRRAVVRALGEIESAAAVDPLSNVLRNDTDDETRVLAAWALGEIEAMGAAPALAAALSDASLEVRRRAIRALAELDNLRTAPPALIAALADPDATVRVYAAYAVGEIGDVAAIPALGALLKDSSIEVRRRAIRALAEIKSPEAARILVLALDDEDPEIRRYAARALGQGR